MTLQRFEIASRQDLILPIVTAIDVALRTDELAEVEIAMPSGLIKVIGVRPCDALAAVAAYLDLVLAEVQNVIVADSRPLTRQERALSRARWRKMAESFSWVQAAETSVRLLPVNSAYAPCDQPPVWLELACGPEGIAVWADLIKFHPTPGGSKPNHGNARIRHGLEAGGRGYFATLAVIAKRSDELSYRLSSRV